MLVKISIIKDSINAAEGVGQGNPFALLVGATLDTAIMKSSMESPQKTQSGNTIPINCSSWCLPAGGKDVMLQ